MTTIHPLPPAPLPERQRRLSLGVVLGALALGTGIGSWVLLSGPQRGVALGGACLLAGALLLGSKLREYAGLALVTVGGLLGGVSLLWLLLFAPAIDRAERQMHDLTHPSVSVSSVDVGGAVDKVRSAIDAARGVKP